MHPLDFHKTEESRSRCWGCSHPEMLESSDEDVKEAAALIAAGFVQTSNKYYGVAKVHAPPFAQAVTFADGVPQWLREEMQRAYEMQVTRWGARSNNKGVEHRELRPGIFFAFKRLGGGVA